MTSCAPERTSLLPKSSMGLISIHSELIQGPLAHRRDIEHLWSDPENINLLVVTRRNTSGQRRTDHPPFELALVIAGRTVGGYAKADSQCRGSTARFRIEASHEAGHRFSQSCPELAKGGTDVAAAFRLHHRQMRGDRASQQI